MAAVSQARDSGLFNPHTMQGDIVVNGIKTSSFTTLVAPALAQSLMWPVRMLYSLGYDLFDEDGIRAFALPYAPKALSGRTEY